MRACATRIACIHCVHMNHNSIRRELFCVVVSTLCIITRQHNKQTTKKHTLAHKYERTGRNDWEAANYFVLDSLVCLCAGFKRFNYKIKSFVNTFLIEFPQYAHSTPPIFRVIAHFCGQTIDSPRHARHL